MIKNRYSRKVVTPTLGLCTPPPGLVNNEAIVEAGPLLTSAHNIMYIGNLPKLNHSFTKYINSGENE